MRFSISLSRVMDEAGDEGWLFLGISGKGVKRALIAGVLANLAIAGLLVMVKTEEVSSQFWILLLVMVLVLLKKLSCDAKTTDLLYSSFIYSKI
jgi:hypothetical protein